MTAPITRADLERLGCNIVEGRSVLWAHDSSGMLFAAKWNNYGDWWLVKPFKDYKPKFRVKAVSV